MADQNLDTPRPGAKPKRSGKEATRTAVALVLGGLLAVFAVLNTEEVTVDWIIGSWQTPLIIVIVVNLVLGFAAGYLVARKGARANRSGT